MRDLNDRQALALHLVHVLACSHTLPADRVSQLAVLAEHVASLGGADFAELRAAINAMLAAETHVQWTFARMDAERALAQMHTAWSLKVIGAMSVKRVP